MVAWALAVEMIFIYVLDASINLPYQLGKCPCSGQVLLGQCSHTAMQFHRWAIALNEASPTRYHVRKFEAARRYTWHGVAALRRIAHTGITISVGPLWVSCWPSPFS